jgi:chromate transporter
VAQEDFLSTYGLGRLVPSGTMTALAVAYGYRFGGFLGTVVALSALTLPAFVLTVALTLAYGLLRGGPVLEILPITLVPAALALIVTAAIRLGSRVFRPSADLALAVTAFLLARVLHLSPSLVLIGGGVLGLVFLREKARS